MNDLYGQAVANPLGGRLAKALGLPRPTALRRYTPGDPLLDGPALVGAASGGRLAGPLRTALASSVVETEDDGARSYAALVFDATGLARVAMLGEMREFFAPVLRRLRPSGRVVVLGVPPEQCGDAEAAAASRALDGFVRSLGKELRAGATANLLYVAEDAAEALASPLRFLLSGRAAYVSGQVLRVGAASVPQPADPVRPLAGRVAVVTGAARGIGASIASTLARDGAEVVCLDVPAQGAALTAIANEVGGTTLQLDITADDAPARLIDHLRERRGGVDILVHNAGVTRDKLLANMDAARWQSVLAVNLVAQLRINEAVLAGEVLREHARVVCLSSTSGIAGNRGQTNYAASKAGIIGMVQALAPRVADAGGTLNAVAPGFIETDMTAHMPTTVREIGRRINSMNQGGLPRDVAETVAWLGQAASGGVNGEVVRVCGQSMLGA
ncbi:MAG: 3-oxoacyl-ACP reductase [Streptosporangiales bacterium]